MMNRLVVFALGAIAVTAGLAPGLRRSPPAADAPSVHLAGGAAASTPRRGAGGEAMVLERDSTGQFHLTATIDSEEVEFLVDTGADTVALTEETADRLGLLPPADEFQPVMKTASGTGYGAPVVIDTVEIGGERFRNVQAVVMRGLETNLLGQSVLGRMNGVELQGDSMVIRPS